MRRASKLLHLDMKTKLLPGPHHPITVEANPTHVTVTLDGRVIAETDRALELREASYPAVQYIPLTDVDPAVLAESDHQSYCPFKGDASYYNLAVDGQTIKNAVWTYRAPYDAVAPIADHVAFYPDKVDISVG
jgi:uncharacterized protein (DUF427 family)